MSGKFMAARARAESLKDTKELWSRCCMEKRHVSVGIELFKKLQDKKEAVVDQGMCVCVCV
jgi:hypothetical protein